MNSQKRLTYNIDVLDFLSKENNLQAVNYSAVQSSPAARVFVRLGAQTLDGAAITTQTQINMTWRIVITYHVSLNDIEQN